MRYVQKHTFDYGRARMINYFASPEYFDGDLFLSTILMNVSRRDIVSLRYLRAPLIIRKQTKYEPLYTSDILSISIPTESSASKLSTGFIVLRGPR